LRSNLVPAASAAIFVTSASAAPPTGLHALARAFDLTAAETRLLEQLAAGMTIDEAAAALGIAKTTTKTHLARIFSKTGVARQAELLALLHRLTPPLAPSPDAPRRH
jgi:DNA-binding CsgD family transcriptional regulator